MVAMAAMAMEGMAAMVDMATVVMDIVTMDTVAMAVTTHLRKRMAITKQWQMICYTVSYYVT